MSAIPSIPPTPQVMLSETQRKQEAIASIAKHCTLCCCIEGKNLPEDLEINNRVYDCGTSRIYCCGEVMVKGCLPIPKWCDYSICVMPRSGRRERHHHHHNNDSDSDNEAVSNTVESTNHQLLACACIGEDLKKKSVDLAKATGGCLWDSAKEAGEAAYCVLEGSCSVLCCVLSALGGGR